ncbi:MAG: nucleoside 2-deoxyribosyltransferase [Candidatus Hydrothermarchaeales archaeon]
MRIYLAGPLFSRAEKEFNEGVAKELEREGHEVFLAQRTCKGKGRKAIFECCLKNLERSHILVAILDGPQVDDGTAFECGYAHARGIPIIGLRTDYRRVGEHSSDLNLMLTCPPLKICRSVAEVIVTLRDEARRYGKESEGKDH